MAQNHKITDKQALQLWENYRNSLMKALPVEANETEKEKRDRIKLLESNPQAWMQYYFANYTKCKPAKFHVAATRRLLANKRHYEVRMWARELAKSVLGMMEDIYMALTGEAYNFLLISNSYDNAERLLMPYMINLESNPRIVHDYGPQIKPGYWEAGDFTTRNGASFRAIGAGQSPRGTRNEDKRPDVIRVDDIDVDEETRNPKRIKDKWEWIEHALIPTVSVSGNYRIIFQGNMIAKNCTIAKACEKADYVDRVNIRDKNGKSTWPEKNFEEAIDQILSKISYKAGQTEYFNNPLSEGTVFKQMIYGKCPPLRELRYVVAYGDPGTSNKAGKGSSFKTVWIIGEQDHKYYVYTGFLDQVGTAPFVEWYYACEEYTRNKTQLLNYVENNSLQDPFYEQVFMPLFADMARKYGFFLNMHPDTRAKKDKFVRIEGNLEPLNRNGQLILNIDEKDNPHMKRLEEQFLMIEEGLPAPADGPDAIEGGTFILKARRMNSTDSMSIGRRYKNPKRV